MTTTTRVVGQSLHAHRRAGQGDRHARLCRRLRAARHAVRQGLPQHRAARPHRAARHEPGARACPACAPSSPRPTSPTCATAPRSRTSRSSPRTSCAIAGQPIAAVAATTLEAAEAALRPSRSVYEPLPARVRPGRGARARRAAGPRGLGSLRRVPILAARRQRVQSRAHRRAATSSAAGRRPTASSSTASPPRMVHQGYTEPRAAVASWDSSGAGHGVVEHPASLRRAEHAGRDPRHRALEDAGHRAGRRRRLRRQAARRRRALRRAAGAQVRPAGQGDDDQRGGADRRLSAPGHA